MGRIHAIPLDGVVLFAVNRDRSRPLVLDVDVRSLAGGTSVQHVAVHDEDADACNTAGAPTASSRARSRPPPWTPATWWPNSHPCPGT